MIRSEFDAIMMRVQQGARSFEHAMEEMFDRVVAAVEGKPYVPDEAVALDPAALVEGATPAPASVATDSDIRPQLSIIEPKGEFGTPPAPVHVDPATELKVPRADGHYTDGTLMPLTGSGVGYNPDGYRVGSEAAPAIVPFGATAPDTSFTGS